MPDTQTLNDTGVNQEVGGIVTSDSPKFDPDTSNTFHDLDEKEEATSATDDKSVEDKGKEKDVADERFDKHPRFQELNTRAKAAEEALAAERIEKARLEGELKARAPKETVIPEELPFKDISKLSVEQLREWQDEDPKGYADNLKAQATYEAKQAIRAEIESKTLREREQGDLKRTYDDFEVKNPAFRKMWDAGEIVAYIEKHPGHNPISAFHEMTIENRIAEATAAATKKAEEEVTKRFMAKKKATVLSGGPSGTVRTEEDPTLSNTKQHGGRTAVIADRLRAMRQASGR
jgi:hypothetical protein